MSTSADFWPSRATARKFLRGYAVLFVFVFAFVAVLACFAHDQVLWATEDTFDNARCECLSELPSILPARFEFGGTGDYERDDAVEWTERTGRIADHEYACELVGVVRDESGQRVRRVCRAILVCDGVGDWTVHSYRIQGETEQVIDHRHSFESRVDDLWLGLYFT